MGKEVHRGELAMMAEPCRMNTNIMDVSFKTYLDGNVMTTTAVPRTLIKWEGHDLRIVDEQAVPTMAVESSSGVPGPVHEGSRKERKQMGRKKRKEMGRKETLEGMGSAARWYPLFSNQAMELAISMEEAERKEIEGKEKERKETKRKDTERKEIERKESERMEMKRKEVERKETERKETERKETERKEMERKETERKEIERKQSERMEMERKELKKKETKRKELERKEKERKETKRKEMERKEIERKKEFQRMEMERKETERKELEGKEMERKESERKEIERKESERMEMERKESERKEIEGKESERMEIERMEMERKEMERKELVTQLQEAKGEIARLEGVIRWMSSERKETERKVMERKETEREESERKETERKDLERKETERKESERKETIRENRTKWRKAMKEDMERKESERKESERMEMERKEMERKEIDRKEEAKDEKMCDGPGDAGATAIIMDWTYMMYRKRKAMEKEMERKETEKKEMERKVKGRKFLILKENTPPSSIPGWVRDVSVALGVGRKDLVDLPTREEFPPLPPRGGGMKDGSERKVGPHTVRDVRVVLPVKETRNEQVVTPAVSGFGVDWKVVARKGGRGGGAEDVSPPLPPRPLRKRELIVAGFHESAGTYEIMEALCYSGGCSEEDIRMGPIRTGNNGLGTMWVQLPVAAAFMVVEKGCILIGRTAARVELLKVRPLQCFKCWSFGHTQDVCRSGANRWGACYRCGQKGHKARDCKNLIHCAVCYDAGLATHHRLGGPLCAALKCQGNKGRSSERKEFGREGVRKGRS